MQRNKRQRWHGLCGRLAPSPCCLTRRLNSDLSDPAFALTFARLENNFINYSWLKDGQLITNAHLMHGLPGAIVHGRYDMPCPARYAFDLHRAWPEADLQLIEGAGHAVTEPGIRDALIRATDRFAGVL